MDDVMADYDLTEGQMRELLRVFDDESPKGRTPGDLENRLRAIGAKPKPVNRLLERIRARPVVGRREADYLYHGSPYPFLNHIQEVHAEWSEENFGDQPSTLPLLGVAEEVGELNHAHLKGIQDIREDDETTGEDAKLDAVGDVVLYLIDYCSREGLSFSDAVQTAVEEVHGREWDSDPAEFVVSDLE
jgi:NTP pyrophosphatase (non-canonical NTP hydrolase)